MKNKMLKVLVLGLASVTASAAFATVCPGTDGVLSYTGTAPEGWETGTQENITKGNHELMQVTWKPGSDLTKGTVYCTYTDYLVLGSKNANIERPTSAAWTPSSIKDVYHCVKDVKNCDFNGDAK